MIGAYTITLAVIRDFMRIRNVEIRPAADRSVFLLAGKNMQGKTSVLRAFAAALGGADAEPVDAVRHGAESAELLLHLTSGESELVVHKVIHKDGGSKLEVRDKNGAIKAPQGVLDKLIGLRFLDPLGFLKEKPKQQRALLLRLIDKENRLPGLEEKRETHYTKRRDVGRDRDKAEGEVARLPDVEAAAPIDIEKLVAESRTFAEKQREGDALGVQRDNRTREANAAGLALQAAQDKRTALLAQLAAIDQTLPQLEREVGEKAAAAEIAEARVKAAAKAWQSSAPRREQIDGDLARAKEHNQEVAAVVAARARRVVAVAEHAQLAARYEELTGWIDKIDQRKAAMLAAAKLPVDGLGVSADGLTLLGVPFEQASGAEQLRVALALAIASAPGLNDVWVRDASLLDEESLKLVKEMADTFGKHVWLEIVGTSVDGAIIMQDGMVVE